MDLWIIARILVLVLSADMGENVLALSSNSSNEVQLMTKFEATGTELLLPFDQFEGIPSNVKATLESVHIQNLQLDPTFLVESLEGCNNLKRLILKNIQFNGPLRDNVVLPKLEKFEVHMYEMEPTTSAEFFSYLFFRQRKPGQTEVNHEILPNGVDVYIKGAADSKFVKYNARSSQLKIHILNFEVTQFFDYKQLQIRQSTMNWKILKMVNLTRLAIFEPTSTDSLRDHLLHIQSSAKNLIDFQYSDSTSQILSVDLALFPAIGKFETLNLQNAYIWSTSLETLKVDNLRELMLKDCTLDLEKMTVSSALRVLSLTNATLVGSNQNTFIVDMCNLQYLFLQMSPDKFFNLASLNNSKETIQNLKFVQMELRVSDPNLTFKNLKRGVFTNCIFDETVLSNFSKLFSKSKDIVVSRTAITFRLLEELLKTSVETIELAENNIKETTHPEISKFLLESNVPRKALNSVKLVKSNMTSTGWTWAYMDDESIRMDVFWRNMIQYTYLTFLIFICCCGLFGNLLSGIVLSRKSMRNSASIILLGLTCFDGIILLTYLSSVLYFGAKLILTFLKFAIPMDSRDDDYYIFWFKVDANLLKSLDEAQYCISYPLNKTAYTGSVYATVLLTLERYVAVCWPLRARSLLRIKSTVYLIIGVILFAIILNFPRWIEAQQSNSFILLHVALPGAISLSFQRYSTGSGLLRYRAYRKYYHGVVWVGLMYIFPIISLTLLNFKIWKQMKSSNTSREAMSSQMNQGKDQKQQAENKSFTRMLVCVITAFVVCNSVSGIVVLILVGYGKWDPSDIEVFSCIPLIINSSINFLLYCFMGTKFRSELIKILPAVLRKRFTTRKGLHESSLRTQPTSTSCII